MHLLDCTRNRAVVTLISANEIPIPAGIDVIQVETVEELAQAVQTQFVSTDVFIMAAAVSDYRPVHFVDHKIKKSADSANLTLELEETTDILKSLKSRRTKQIVVGFAAETNDLLNNAKKKLDSKGADIIVATMFPNRILGLVQKIMRSPFCNTMRPILKLQRQTSKLLPKRF